MTKTVFPLLVSLLFTATSRAQKPPVALHIEPVTPTFYVYTSYGTFEGRYVPANGAYWVTTKGVVLIDCPWDSTQFQPLLDSIQARHHQAVVWCLATHFHSDRTDGLDYYRSRGIATFTTRKTDSLSAIYHSCRAKYLLAGDTTFSLGGGTFQLFYPGAGHSPDNVVLYFPGERILYGGCFLKSADDNNLGNLSDANVASWEQALLRVRRRFAPRYWIVGHGRWRNGKSLAHTLALVRAYLHR